MTSFTKSKYKSSIMKQQRIFSSDAEALLAVKLFQLRNRSGNHDSTQSQEAIGEIYDLVVTHDDSFKDRMVAMSAMDTLVEAIKCPSESIGFLHRAAGVVVELVEASTDRSTCFIEAGGIDCILNILKTYESNCFVVTSYVSVFVMLLYVVTNEQRVAFAAEIFEAVTIAMERHSGYSYMYEISCIVIGLCYGPGVVIPIEAWSRAVQCTFDGIVVLRGHEDAQVVGRHLLIHMVGPSVARKMIHHAEMHHCQGATCSCAA